MEWVSWPSNNEFDGPLEWDELPHETPYLISDVVVGARMLILRMHTGEEIELRVSDALLLDVVTRRPVDCKELNLFVCKDRDGAHQLLLGFEVLIGGGGKRR